MLCHVGVPSLSVAKEYVLVEFDDKSTYIIQQNCEQLSVTVGDSDVENHCSVNRSDGNQYDGKIVFSGT